MLLTAIFDLLPLFSRLLLTSQPMGPTEYALFLDGWFPLLLLFLLWAVVRMLVAGYTRHSRRVRMLCVAIACAGAILIMLTLQVIKLRQTNEFFYLTLAALGLDAAAHGVRKRVLLNIVLRFLGHVILGYLPFQAARFAWQWQPLLFAAGIAALLAALHTALALHYAWQPPEKPVEQNWAARRLRYTAHGYSVLLLLAPTCIAMLGLSGRLPAGYGLMYLIAPAAARLVTQSRSGSEARTADFVRQNYAICLLFVEILVLIGVVS